MKKRPITLLLSAVLTASLLSGCSNNSDSDVKVDTNVKVDTDVNVDTGDIDEGNIDEGDFTKHEHSYTESTTKEATCTETGEKTFTCDCGDTYTEAIEATGHNYEVVTDSAINATCETDGKEADTKCSLCADVVSGTVIPATGHTYGEYISNNDATYIADGTETATCVCGLTDTRTVEGSKLEYTYTDITKTMYAKSAVNVRNLPSTDGEKLGGLDKAQEVAVTGQCNETGWYRIDYNGNVAYVSDNYLQNDKPVEETPAPTTPSGNSEILNPDWWLREDGVYCCAASWEVSPTNIGSEWIGKTIAEFCENQNTMGVTINGPFYDTIFLYASEYGDYVIGSRWLFSITGGGQQYWIKSPF